MGSLGVTEQRQQHRLLIHSSDGLKGSVLGRVDRLMPTRPCRRSLNDPLSDSEGVFGSPPLAFVHRRTRHDRLQVHRNEEKLMSRKVVLTCAVTGNAPFNRNHPTMPVTPVQIADACLEAACAGASVVHIHVRDPKTGEGSRSTELYKEVVDRVRATDQDIVINLTCGHGAFFLPDPVDESRGLPESDVIGTAERVKHLEQCLSSGRRRQFVAIGWSFGSEIVAIPGRRVRTTDVAIARFLGGVRGCQARSYTGRSLRKLPAAPMGRTLPLTLDRPPAARRTPLPKRFPSRRSQSQPAAASPKPLIPAETPPDELCASVTISSTAAALTGL